MGGLMLRVRRLALATAIGIAALCAFGATQSFAASPLPPCPFVYPPAPANPPESVQSTHFIVYYTVDPTVSGSITQTQAGAILAAAERAYASYTADGFPAPAVDGTGKTEFDVTDLSQWNVSSVYCSGAADVNFTDVTGADMPYVIGFDVFTQVEFSLGGGPDWLANGAAAWASWRALGYPASSIADIGPFSISLDCTSFFNNEILNNCSQNGYEDVGESRWPFYEYLSETYGPLFMTTVFADTSAALGDGDAGLQNALASKGSSLAAAYAGYAAKLLTGGWTATALDAATIPVDATKIQTGTSTGSIPSASFGINHLATTFVEIDRGDGDGSHQCYTATLTLNVQIPAGVTSQPTFYWAGGGSSPVPLTVSGNTATATVPWDTCLWKSSGYLSLPNTSLVDGTSFVVSGTLKVDFTTPATAALPPAAASQFGQVISASSFSSAPNISLFGPKVTTLTGSDSTLDVVVSSDGEGTMKVALGSLSLGTIDLAAGTDKHEFTLSSGALAALQLAGAAGLPLTLTPLGTNGVKGTAVTGSVVLVPTASTTAKLKPAKPATKKTKAVKKPATKHKKHGK
jgi:hypothetical protein